MQTNLLKPKASMWSRLAATAQVTLEPFERRYGHTLATRCAGVLLSSMVGYAPTE